MAFKRVKIRSSNFKMIEISVSERLELELLDSVLALSCSGLAAAGVD